MTAPAPDNLATAKPRRRRRWWLRIPLILIALVAMILVLTQIFLWTDYPRQIAEAQVERILRVRASIKSVSIGWLGNTRIEGVALTLPMEDEPFLRIGRIDASHASLPLIAFGEDLRFVQLHGVDITARQDSSGRWNLEQLLPPPASNDGATSAALSRPRNPLAGIPSSRMDVSVTLIRHDGKRIKISPMDLAFLKRDAALTADLTGDLGTIGTFEGEIGQSAMLPQSLTATFNGLPTDLADFFGVKLPSPLSAKLVWTGHLTADGIAGNLNILGAQADTIHAAGRVELEAGSHLVARPIDLHVTMDDAAAIDVVATGGAMTYDGKVIATALAGTLNGGRCVVDGTFDPRTLGADVTAKWEEVTRNALATTGSAHVKAARLFNGKIKVDAQAKGGLRVPAGEASGAFTIDGEADSLETFAADLTLDPFTWTPADGSTPIVTPRLVGDVSGRGTDVFLQAECGENVTFGSLTTYAGINLATRIWWANLDASRVDLPAVAARGVKGPIDVSLAAGGTLSFIHVSRAYAKLDKATAYAVGDYDFSLPRPLGATAWAWYDKPVTEDEAAQLNSARAQATIEGTLAPRDLKAVIDLSGSELVFAGRPVGDVALNVDAVWTDDEATIHSKEIEALGGRWMIDGRWAASENAPPKIVATFRDVPAANIGAMFGRDDVNGTIDGGTATMRIRSSRLDRLDMTATARGADLAVGVFRADALDLAASARNGKFEVTPTLHHQGGKLAATFTGDVLLTRPVHAEITLENWPAPYVESTAVGAQRFRPRASGTARGDASLRTGEVSGQVALGGRVERGDDELATFRVEGSLKDKQITVTKAALGTLDGTLAATAAIDLADWNASRLDATFDKLTPARLSWSNPLAAEISGAISGTLAIRPIADPRALGPIQIELTARPEGVVFRNVDIGDLDVRAYADVTSANQFRIVTEQATLHVAGGTIEPFARVSSEPGRGAAQLVTAQFSCLDLGQIGKALDDDGKPLVGKIGGRVQIYGQTTRLDTLAGDATIDITDSDLVNFGPITALYNVLSVGTAGSKPIGAGTVNLRFGDDVLTIEDATYFNRGVYANAFGPIRGISKGVDAEVDHAIIVGSLQPLRAVKLPFFGDINDTLAALQSSLTAIEVTGSAKDPKMRQVSIGAIGDTFQKILLGKARGEGK